MFPQETEYPSLAQVKEIVSHFENEKWPMSKEIASCIDKTNKNIVNVWIGANPCWIFVFQFDDNNKIIHVEQTGVSM